MEIIWFIFGVLLLILNICMIVKFFQIAKNVEKLTDLYVNGIKEDQDSLRFYKLPVVEDEEKTKKIEEERKKQQEKINRMTIYYQKQ